MADRVVLAYSGGLDTSVGIGWLKDATGKEVVALAVDVGQGGEDMEAIRQRALDCGAVEAVVIDAKDEFANDYLMPALKANALYQKRYPLVSALSRPLIAKHLALTAKQLGADSVAHGCTGKGNDQVRFEAAVAALAPDLTASPRSATSHSPATRRSSTRRSTTCRSRRARSPVLDRPERLGPRGRDRVPRGPVERPDRGPLRLHAGPGDRAWPTRSPSRSSRASRWPRRLALQRPRIVEELNALAGKHGVGRIDIVEDRLVGIKAARSTRPRPRWR